MGFLFDYLDHQFATFEEMPLGPVDAAAISQFAMMNSGAVVPAIKSRASFCDEQSLIEDPEEPAGEYVHFVDLLRAENFETMFGGEGFSVRERDLVALAASPRFRDLKLANYISLLDTKNEAQFAAVTLTYKDQFGIIDYRGTDGTYTGWKEDFNMGFKAPVPAQFHALHYFKAVADRLPEKIYVIGHSKGGNLAEYVATKVAPELQKRIVQVYNLDGPGFKEGFITEEEYAPIIDRIYKIAPTESLVGILLFSPVPMHVVPSVGQGFGTHSVYTWEVNEENTDFVDAGSLSDKTMLLAQTLRAWITQYDDEKREALTESLFQVIANTGQSSMADVLSGGLATVAQYLDGAAVKDEKDVAAVVEAGRSFIDTAAGIALRQLAARAAQQKADGEAGACDNG